MADAGSRGLGPGSLPVPAGERGVRQHPSLAGAPIRPQHELWALRGDPRHLSGTGLRSRQHHLRQGRDRLDRLRPPDGSRDGSGGEAAGRRAPGRAGRWWPWSTPIPTATIGAACAASSTRRTCGRARSRSSRPAASWTHAVSENVYAGNAMNRRLFYQYGVLLPAEPLRLRRQGLASGRRGRQSGLDRAEPASSSRTSRSSPSTASRWSSEHAQHRGARPR